MDEMTQHSSTHTTIGALDLWSKKILGKERDGPTVMNKHTNRNSPTRMANDASQMEGVG